MPGGVKISIGVETAQAQSALTRLLDTLRARLDALNQFNQRINQGTRALNQVLVQGLTVLGANALRLYAQSALQAARSQAQLAAALRASGQFSADYAAELQGLQQRLKQTIGAEEEAVAAVQRLLISFGVARQHMPELTERVFDLAAALGVDAVTAARQLGAALAGQDVTGGRLRLEIDRTLPRAQQLAQALDQLRRRFGGQAAAAFADSMPEFRRFALALDDAKKAVGNLVLALSGPLIEALERGVLRLKAWADRLNESARTQASFTANLSRASGEFLAEHLPALVALMAGLVALRGAFFLLKIPMDLLRSAFFLLVGRGFLEAAGGLQKLTARITETTLITHQLGKTIASLRVALLSLPGAVATAGAALAGIVAGDFISKLEVTSGKVRLKIADWAALMSVELMRSWAGLRHTLGQITDEQLKAIQKNLDETAFRIQFGEAPGRITPRPRPAPAGPDLDAAARQIEALERARDIGLARAAVAGSAAQTRQAEFLAEEAYRRGLLALDKYLERRAALIQAHAATELIPLRREFEALEQELEAKNAEITALKGQPPSEQAAAQLVELEKERTELVVKRAELANQIKTAELEAATAVLRLEAERPWGFIETMSAGLARLREAWGNFAANLGTTFLDSIRAGVQGVSDAILGAIEGTRTWGQVFLQVGRQILASVIHLVVNFIAQATILAALQRAFAALGLKTLGAQGAGMALAFSPAAMARSIAELGPIAGPLLFKAAMAASLGIGAAAGLAGAGAGLAAGLQAREHGGPVLAGRAYIVGERRPELFIPRESGVVIPRVPDIVLAGPPGRNTPQAIVNDNRIKIAVFDDPARLRDFWRSEEGRGIFVDLLRQHAHEVGLT